MSGRLWTSACWMMATGALTLVGCNKSSPPAPAGAESKPLAISDAARTEAKEIFSTRCTPCHGQTGSGDGPTAAVLTPKPRNFHDATWQKNTSNEQIEKIIKMGGAAVGKSPLMPPNPDLADKNEVVAALREQIRAFGEK